MSASVIFKGKLVGSLEVGSADKLSDVKKAVAHLAGVPASRVELRGSDPANDKASKERDPRFVVKRFEGEIKTAAELGLDNAQQIFVKDLGPQVGYRTVFYVEYLGPIAIVLIAMLRGALPLCGPYLFGGARPLSLGAALTWAHLSAAEGTPQWRAFVQALAITMWLAHFVKRELETAFLHKFSRPTMPLSNLFKNCTYYWSFAFFCAYPLVHPAYQAPGKVQVVAGAVLWVACQLTNLAVHAQLAGMRGAEGDNARKPPGGPLFSLVTSPNYFAEFLGWAAWSATSSIFMGYIFTLVGLLQMTQWALQKYAGYVRGGAEGKAYARARKSIIPFVL